MLRLNLKVILLLLSICLAACSDSTQSEQTSADKKQEAGRAETKTIRSTENIGYAGDAIGSKVDAALDANDQRKDELDKQIDEQTGSEGSDKN